MGSKGQLPTCDFPWAFWNTVHPWISIHAQKFKAMADSHWNIKHRFKLKEVSSFIPFSYLYIYLSIMKWNKNVFPTSWCSQIYLFSEFQIQLNTQCLHMDASQAFDSDVQKMKFLPVPSLSCPKPPGYLSLSQCMPHL